MRQAISAPIAGIRGQTFTFTCRIEGDVWHLSLDEADGAMTERWRRVPAGQP